jgi:hypothetical protein
VKKPNWLHWGMIKRHEAQKDLQGDGQDKEEARQAN